MTGAALPPDNRPGMRLQKTFQLLTPTVAPASVCTARLGRLVLPGRRVIDTPNYVAPTARGAVPHVTPDNLRRHTAISAVYLGLEDFMERKEPPIFNSPSADNGGPLHNFTALAPDIATILAARRCPPVLTPTGNGVKTVSLLTSTGFTNMTVAQFASAAEALRPDVLVALGDALHTSVTPSSKKLFKMAERTESWLNELLRLVGGREHLDELGVSLFAPVLPVEHAIQWEYLRHLAEDAVDALSGLAIYDTNMLPELVSYPALTPLPKLSLEPPPTPHEALRQVALGVDLCTLPFVNDMSDSGVALAFAFPAPTSSETLPLGIDMWSPEHCTSLAPLVEDCQCHTCIHHHRAYLHHLLNTKEMLGWSLLQVHNHHVAFGFFVGIRRSLAEGSDLFEQEVRRFRAVYELELPAGSGVRPRARGYHFKSEAKQGRMNMPSWTDLESTAAVEPA